MPVQIVMVTSPRCDFCEDAEATLLEFSRTRCLDIRLIPNDSPEGRRLVQRFHPSTYPLIVVDGAAFSTGRLHRQTLAAYLTVLESQGASHGRPRRRVEVIAG